MHGIDEIPLRITEDEWLDYYEGCLEYDNYPLSPMMIHLDETVYPTVDSNMITISITYDGCFKKNGLYYTPPQT